MHTNNFYKKGIITVRSQELLVKPLYVKLKKEVTTNEGHRIDSLTTKGSILFL